MKLEKREITLNEKDSLTDALYMQKTLLYAYVCALEHAVKQETRKTLLRFMQQTGEDLFLIDGLRKGADEE